MRDSDSDSNSTPMDVTDAFACEINCRVTIVLIKFSECSAIKIVALQRMTQVILTSSLCHQPASSGG